MEKVLEIIEKEEIERKFMPDKMPDNLDQYPSKKMMAGWLMDEYGKKLRIRREGDQYFKVYKTGKGLVRGVGEGDQEIFVDEFESLWPKTEGWRISKTRYYIPIPGGFTAEFDIYDDYPGKYSLEVEFETKDQADKFIPPEWFGKEVTEDVRYSNSRIARKGWPE